MKKADLDIYVTITDSKLSSKKRIVEIVDFHWLLRDKRVVLETTCWPLDEKGELVNSLELPAFGVQLVADNTTVVDPSTGLITDPPAVVDDSNKDWNKGLIGQYDFLRALATQPVALATECEQYVLLAVSRGRYDI